MGGFVAGCDGSWRGLSLTMPLKQAALALGEVDEVAALAGAANTLIFSDSGVRLFNTDVGGLVDAVRRYHPERLRRVAILGSGATARSAVISARGLGARSVVVVARDPGKADPMAALAAKVDVELRVQPWDQPIPGADLVIAAVTAGAADSRADEIAEQGTVIFDAIYHPWPTPVAVAAQAHGRVVVSGLDLLVHQAVAQVELMTGLRPSAELLLSAGRAALRSRSSP